MNLERGIDGDLMQPFELVVDCVSRESAVRSGPGAHDVVYAILYPTMPCQLSFQAGCRASKCMKTQWL